LMGLMAFYRPVWPGGTYDDAAMKARTERMGKLTQDKGDSWRRTLDRINNREWTPEATLVALPAGTPSLFRPGGYDEARADVLRQRIDGLTPPQVEQVSRPLKLPGPWAAMLIAGEDAFFDGPTLNEARFAQGVKALSEAVPK